MNRIKFSYMILVKPVVNVNLLLVLALLIIYPNVQAHASDPQTGFTYDDYAVVLFTYVNNEGLVDYGGLKSNRDILDNFIEKLGNLDPGIFSSWDDEDQIAFLINAYNACTLKAIIDHYPIKSSFVKSFIYPKNSIRQIDGVWDKLMFTILGKPMTLDDIEHRELRAKYDEPRIHMALVCAARGCPFLRKEPYRGAKLNVQLDDQTHRFLDKKQNFLVDTKDRKIFLSSIFKWFGEDFTMTYGRGDLPDHYAESEAAVLNFVGTYLGAREKRMLFSERYRIEYLDYDWSLNEK